MTQYGTLTAAIISELTDLIGEKNVVVEKEKIIDYSHDEYSQKDIQRFPDAVVKPVDSMQVSAILKLATRHKIPVTPRGGGTGLCGGCVPVFGGIVLSLENMKKVIEVDKENLMVVAEAGVTLMDFYKHIESEGLFFPPHPGDEGATVGGVIATNAGGARAVKYGVIRDFIRGIEVVLPNGEVANIGGKLMKNSTGYSLLNLLIGSEGTLGIVTRASISLIPPPGAICTLVVPFPSLSDAISTVPKIMQGKIMPMAVEFLDTKCVKITEDFTNKKWPCKEGPASLMIVLDGLGEDEVLQMAEKVGEICLANNAIDVFIADDKAKQQSILDVRSHIYEAMRNNMLEILDVVVPRASIADFVTGADRIAEEEGIWMPTYGHAADGNVHTHIMKATWEDGKWIPTNGWEEKFPRARKRVHELGRSFNGLVSGEHGIGLIKKEYLERFLGAALVDLMKSIKNVFDPQGILNPGKIFKD